MSGTHSAVLQPVGEDGSPVSSPQRVTVTVVHDDGPDEWLGAVFDLTDPVAGTQAIWHTYHRPSLEAVLREDGLWTSTCYECFVGVRGGPYVELNLSPEGRFNLYAFTAHRTPGGMPPPRLLDGRVLPGEHVTAFHQWGDMRRLNWTSPSAGALAFIESLERRVPTTADGRVGVVFSLTALRSLWHVGRDAAVAVNPTMVVDTDFQLSYWAARHASPPDFHDTSTWMDA